MSDHNYKFNVTMTCSGCSGAVERVLKKMDGKPTPPDTPYPVAKHAQSRLPRQVQSQPSNLTACHFMPSPPSPGLPLPLPLQLSPTSPPLTHPNRRQVLHRLSRHADRRRDDRPRGRLRRRAREDQEDRQDRQLGRGRRHLAAGVRVSWVRRSARTR